MEEAAHALIRFGLGRRAGEALPADPKAWLLSQLASPGPDSVAGLPDTAAALRTIRQDRAMRHFNPEAAQQAKLALRAWEADAVAELSAALDSETPFRERLVWFWSNHFTVSTRRGIDAALIGPFVREAIRPHVTGRFSDMLHAVMRHPAMLFYLDNASSAGPDSRLGQQRQRGLNENLARESLELHTVTPASGYTQTDVTEYAAILTGWSVDMEADPPGFRFRPMTHEPGRKRLLGRWFDEGEAGGMAALEFLGTHPATYQALARALARHFIADTPPEPAVSRIAARLRATRGDLAAAAAAMVAEPAAWQPGTKLRSPLDYTVAVLRAAGPQPGDAHGLIGVLHNLGQPLWAAPLPNGFPDQAADWADPETLLRRADWTWRLASRMGDQDPFQIARDSLGPLLTQATTRAMADAGGRRQALTVLFTSPGFMRR